MSRRASYSLIVVVSLGCGSATCLYSGAGPMDPLTAATGGAWAPWLAIVADLLTAPIPTEGIVDVRDVVPFAFLGIALMIVALSASPPELNEPPAEISVTNREPPPDTRTPHPAPPIDAACAAQGPGLFAPSRWLLACSAGVFVLTLASLPMSSPSGWGWVARFAAGCGWAILLARSFTPRMVRATLPWLLAIGVVAIALGFVHARDRGYAHPSWPIGPITITAALAGCWAAMAIAYTGGWLLLRKGDTGSGRFNWSVLAALVSTGLFIAALAGTGRRSSLVGLIAATIFAGAITIICRWPKRAARCGVGIACFLALCVAIGYVAREATSSERIRSGPLLVRLAYIEQSWKMIRQHPLLGIGPDRFVVNMTNAMAPLRAVSPQVYHGNYDPAAHNEWLQATVELGVPAAALYAAIPIGVIIMALRRCRRQGDMCIAIALSAGLAAICVTEIASITLRGPIMPMWYWTLLGLLAASASPPHAARVGPSPAWRVLLILPAIACMAIAARELSASNQALLRAQRMDQPTAGRLYMEKWLSNEYAGAIAELDTWTAAPSPGEPTRLLDRWRRLYELLPGYQDVPARYAECLMWVKRVPEGKAVLEAALSDRLNPYEPRANLVYAGMVDDWRTRLLCAQRALRSSDITEQLGLLITNRIAHINDDSALADELARARRVAAGEGADEELKGPIIELLRVSAYQRENENDFAGMRDDLRLIAGCYERMERESHPYRRTHEAEADAFFRLSRAIAIADPSQYREALEVIRKAERFAVMGLKHEDVANPQSELGYIGGEVVPTEFPARLRPMWNKSALYHLIAGDDRFLDLRIFASLDPGYWAEDELHLRLHGLARSAYQILSRLPPEARPPHFDQLPAMADHYWRLAMQSPRFNRPPPASAPVQNVP